MIKGDEFFSTLDLVSDTYFMMNRNPFSDADMIFFVEVIIRELHDVPCKRFAKLLT